MPFDSGWNHLSGLQLADPDFGRPVRIDILLGIDIFTEVLGHGRRFGPPGSPSAFETSFGWVLAGNTRIVPSVHVTTHVSLASVDDMICKFWEIEESPNNELALSVDEHAVVHHFRTSHRRKDDGRFIVPLPRKANAKPIGESRTQAVRRFLSLERSLQSRNQFEDFKRVIDEYFDLNHAEPVPHHDLEKPPHEVFYLPMHAVYKESSSTTKVRVVFDASAKSDSGISLNDTLMVGPTVHPPLLDVLLRFRIYRIALVADVSKMYRAIELTQSDRDFHRFVWRTDPREVLQDYRMTRVTFGVAASSFAANMSMKQNALDYAHEFPLAAKVVTDSFYVDDCLTGADTVEDAIRLQQQLQSLFSKGDFILRKWNSNNSFVLNSIPMELQDPQIVHSISDTINYTKTLGIEWNRHFDHFRLTIAKLPPLESITKRILVSDIAKTFDVLGWFAPTVIKAKILLQKLWELKVDWDSPIPQPIFEVWMRWRSELPLLSDVRVPRCYFPQGVQIVSLQVHGFSDTSESAYGAVIYLRMVDSCNRVYVISVISKSKVAPIKKLTIPRLELCGAHLLSRLIRKCTSFHLTKFMLGPTILLYSVG